MKKKYKVQQEKKYNKFFFLIIKIKNYNFFHFYNKKFGNIYNYAIL